MSLEGFLGYGSDDPLVLFLGTEESNGGGGAAAIQARRTQFQRIEDVYEASQLLARADPEFVNPFAGVRNHVQQWNAASRLRLALGGENWSAPQDWQRYWRTYLGRRNGDTFLMECFPVPRANSNVWIKGYKPNSTWTTTRMPLLRDFTNSIQPRYVVAYGDVASARVADLFPVVVSPYDGRNSVWHDLQTMKPSSVGKTATGVAVARVGFFGQGYFSQSDIRTIVQAMWTLGIGQVPCRHTWP